MRDLTAGMQSALVQRVVRPVLIGRLDIADDPVYAWTGPGLFMPTGTADSALNGLTFDPAEDFISVSAIKEDQDIGTAVTITAQGHDLNQDLLRQVVRDKRAWRGKAAYLWLALLDSDEAAVVSDPVRIKTGVITSITVVRGPDTANVQVVIDEDLGNSKSAPFRIMDHPRLYPADTFSTFMAKLANKPKGLDASDIFRLPTLHGGYPGFSFPYGIRI